MKQFLHRFVFLFLFCDFEALAFFVCLFAVQSFMGNKPGSPSADCAGRWSDRKTNKKKRKRDKNQTDEFNPFNTGVPVFIQILVF